MKFKGFDRPNYTKVPNALLDELLPDLNEYQLKVLIYITRHTFGYQKDVDTLSIDQMESGIKRRDGTQIDRGTGVSKSSIKRALNDLEEMGLILRIRRSSAEKGNLPTAFGLRFSDPPLGPVGDQAPWPTVEPSLGPVGDQPLVQGGTTQKKELNKTSKENSIPLPPSHSEEPSHEPTEPISIPVKETREEPELVVDTNPDRVENLFYRVFEGRKFSGLSRKHREKVEAMLERDGEEAVERKLRAFAEAGGRTLEQFVVKQCGGFQSRKFTHTGEEDSGAHSNGGYRNGVTGGSNGHRASSASKPQKTVSPEILAFVETWNAAFPSNPAEPRYLPVSKIEAAMADGFDLPTLHVICAKVAAIRKAKGDEVSWLCFGWLFGRNAEEMPNWYRLKSGQFDFMAKPAGLGGLPKDTAATNPMLALAEKMKAKRTAKGVTP